MLRSRPRGRESARNARGRPAAKGGPGRLVTREGQPRTGCSGFPLLSQAPGPVSTGARCCRSGGMSDARHCASGAGRGHGHSAAQPGGAATAGRQCSRQSPRPSGQGAHLWARVRAERNHAQEALAVERVAAVGGEDHLRHNASCSHPQNERPSVAGHCLRIAGGVVRLGASERAHRDGSRQRLEADGALKGKGARISGLDLSCVA